MGGLRCKYAVWNPIGRGGRLVSRAARQLVVTVAGMVGPGLEVGKESVKREGSKEHE